LVCYAGVESGGKGDRRAFSGNRLGDMQLRRPPKMPVSLSMVLELAMVVLRRRCFSIDVLLLIVCESTRDDKMKIGGNLLTFIATFYRIPT
jgi:hypothetical protein